MQVRRSRNGGSVRFLLLNIAMLRRKSDFVRYSLLAKSVSAVPTSGGPYQYARIRLYRSSEES